MLELLVITLCLIANAFIACAEMAFVSIPKQDLKEALGKGRAEAGLILKLRESPERPLSVIQLGITLVAAISAAVGGAGAEESLTPYLVKTLSIKEPLAEWLSIALVVLPLTFLTVLLGEIIPKTIALEYTNKIAFKSAKWIYFFDRVLSPLVGILETCTKIFFKLFIPSLNRKNPHRKHQSAAYIINLMNAEQAQVSKILTSFDKVDFIQVSEDNKTVMEKISTSGHTRLPVMNIDGSIKGFLHTKEYLSVKNAKPKTMDWHTLIRDPVYIDEKERALQALRVMQTEKVHLLFVKNRLGKTTGLITLTDIIEEIIGDIDDEENKSGLNPLILIKRQKG